MPTNISKPRWICDICGECHEENRAAAERCEAAGPPVTLPDGELLLTYDAHSYRPSFGLVVLHPHPRIVTAATKWNETDMLADHAQLLDLAPCSLTAWHRQRLIAMSRAAVAKHRRLRHAVHLLLTSLSLLAVAAMITATTRIVA
jgi:hypothetical protein